jgi:peptidoglycan-associated lipoprotein
MKLYFIIAVSAFAFAQNGFSQSGDTILFGKVIEYKTKKVIPNAVVKIVGTLGTSLEIIANEDGKYFATKTQLKEGESYVITCGLSEHFLNRTGKFTLYPNFPSNAIERNFELDPSRTVCRMIPMLSFMKNSSSLSEEALLNLDGLVETMNDNPTIVFEVQGNADSRERNPKELSEKRAKSIANYLVKSKIETERVIAIGYGPSAITVLYDTNLFKAGDILDEEFISKLKDKESIEESIKLNGSAFFKVVRSDYKSLK